MKDVETHNISAILRAEYDVRFGATNRNDVVGEALVTQPCRRAASRGCEDDEEIRQHLAATVVSVFWRGLSGSSLDASGMRSLRRCT